MAVLAWILEGKCESIEDSSRERICEGIQFSIGINVLRCGMVEFTGKKIESKSRLANITLY